MYITREKKYHRFFNVFFVLVKCLLLINKILLCLFYDRDKLKQNSNKSKILVQNAQREAKFAQDFWMQSELRRSKWKHYSSYSNTYTVEHKHIKENNNDINDWKVVYSNHLNWIIMILQSMFRIFCNLQLHCCWIFSCSMTRLVRSQLSAL